MNTASLKHLYNKIPKFITGLTLLAFFVLVFVGMFDCMNPIMQSRMSMEGSAHSMTDCVPGKNCGMNINEHLGIWQGMFTTILNTDFFNLLATLFVLLSTAVALFKIFSFSDTETIAGRYLIYERSHRDNRLYNYLVGIFASGIVQPKIFA